jgi:uncharacterized radical SAM superfamily Fe-S cluster-containing enzyme
MLGTVPERAVTLATTARIPKTKIYDAKYRFGLHQPAVTFELEQCPFETVQIDVTHRCNMGCKNCYIPNRDIPDLDAKWIESMVRRLPRGRFLRFVGAEPTMRSDLPELIHMVRQAGHHPVLLSNGLKLANLDYMRELKRAGLSILYLSLNGVFNDDLYNTVDGMRCAKEKRAAFENAAAERILTSVGMIVVQGVSEPHVKDFWQAALSKRSVLEVHLRSVGQVGRFMKNTPLKLDQLMDVFISASNASEVDLQKRVQLTQWPDLNSTTRGRLTLEVKVAPFFEHMIENEGGY